MSNPTACLPIVTIVRWKKLTNKHQHGLNRNRTNKTKSCFSIYGHSQTSSFQPLLAILTWNKITFPWALWIKRIAHLIQGCSSRHELPGFSTIQCWSKHWRSSTSRATLSGNQNSSNPNKGFNVEATPYPMLDLSNWGLKEIGDHLGLPALLPFDLHPSLMANCNRPRASRCHAVRCVG